MIDQLLDKANCNQAGEYNSLKQGGRIARKQELQKIFADPEAMSRYSQRDINAMWDELQGKNEHRMTGFIEWVNRYQHESHYTRS
jgi:RNAse (barnase) inhibitor barstar